MNRIIMSEHKLSGVNSLFVHLYLQQVNVFDSSLGDTFCYLCTPDRDSSKADQSKLFVLRLWGVSAMN